MKVLIKMKMKTKFILSVVFVGIISVLLASAMVGWTSTESGKQALEKSAKEQLIAIREIKKAQIEDYFHFIEDQVTTFSNDRMIIDAMKEFSLAFNSYIGEQDLSGHINNIDVSAYYYDEFNTQYAELNEGNTLDINQLISGLDDEALALQHKYIQTNPHPLGAKDELLDAGGNSRYEFVHKKYHAHIRDYLQKFGYYDIFLVDSNTGDIVYSVSKALDYATSLIDGPYADSGIAEAFKGANALNENDSFVLTDFKPYSPSYESPASFIASPIYDNGVKQGVLIFQMPVDKINEIMTYNQQWAASGLGKSGETYLVGSDKTMRSIGRFIIDDRESYLSLLNDTGYSKDLITTISNKGTTIGLQSVDTKGVNAALNGQTGFEIFPDYRGVSVLSAYSPIQIAGLKWVIMSEIDEVEAFAPVQTLINNVKYFALVSVLIIAGIAIIMGLLLGQVVSKPLLRMRKMKDAVTDCVNDIAGGAGDLTFRLDDSEKDEFSDMATAINSFVETMQAVIREVVNAASKVASASEDLLKIVANTNEGVERQYKETEQLATTMNEMISTAQDVASNASGAALSANEADEKAKNGLNIVTATVDSINLLASEVEKTSDEISLLENDSQSIGSVLDVIRDIAEQTNLLALNAAIEAARAGEQGRGFAVVADEVRTLASRTQSSTQEIQQMIENLQNRTRHANQMMQNSCSNAKKSVTNAAEAGAALQAISEAISNIDLLNTQIATAAEEQTAAAEEINKTVVSLSDIESDTATSSEYIKTASNSLTQLAHGLESHVTQFKI
jgi:methyl-accepting chemotaxis protein